ncbi:MAG: Spermidine/putrescine import ATP-binding protein PotA [Burkholderiaceae bacterium]|nr:Spermidine/putrescine import ATP-binding protein PotA [Burkholderiaceae bacterium]
MAAIWEVDLRRVLAHAGSRFELQVRFSSEARRLVLYGPSGAGKTQTLRMIAGVAQPDGGRVAVAGRTLFDSAAGIRVSPQARRLATVFQEYALFPHLTVRQNAAFALRRGWRNPAAALRDASVERWLAAFRLEPVADHYPHQISGGQRQRTALARALVNEPAALLLDEPFAALDKALRQRLRDELSELLAQLRLPMLLITHDDDDVRLLADEVVALRDGRVVDGAAIDAGAA